MGCAPLAVAVIADVGAMLIVCLNGMRVLDDNAGAGGHQATTTTVEACVARDDDDGVKKATAKP